MDERSFTVGLVVTCEFEFGCRIAHKGLPLLCESLFVHQTRETGMVNVEHDFV